MALLAEFRVLDRRVWMLAAARMVVTAGFSMVLPFLAMYLSVERQVPAVIVGLIWTVAGACGAGMQWVAGELADRVGRRPVMVAAMILRALNLAGLGYATALQADVFVLGALCVANSMLRSFFDPVANALVADLVPPERRVAAFSLQRVGINIGWAAGPAVAAVAADVPYSQLFYWSVPVTLVAAFGVAIIKEPTLATATAQRGPSWREIFAFRDDKPFVRFLLATVAFYVLQVQLYQSLSIFAASVLGLGRAEVGTIYMLNGALVVVLQLPAVGFIQRLGTRGALVIGCLVYAAAYASVGLAVGHLSMLVCVACVTLAEILTAPAQQATVASIAPAGRIGAYSGLFGLCQVVGQSTGPLIGTALLDAVPPRAAWFLIALFGVAAALTYRLSNTASARVEGSTIMRRSIVTEKE